MNNINAGISNMNYLFTALDVTAKLTTLFFPLLKVLFFLISHSSTGTPMARFLGRWIRTIRPVSWQPRSHNLSPIIFFLWGVYQGCRLFNKANQSRGAKIQN
jgi:hypothetical protein